MPEVMRCVLLSTLEAVEGGLCFVRCVRGAKNDAMCALCTLEAVEGGFVYWGCWRRWTCRR